MHNALSPATEGIAISHEASMPPADQGGPSSPPTGAAQATFGEVFAVGEFRALWLAQVLSVAGDQLARVALTLLVFDRTGSPLLAAVTFAASVVPTFVGGITLSGLADRWPRRRVMIACDLSRALLVATMALPGMPVGGVMVGFFGVHISFLVDAVTFAVSAMIIRIWVRARPAARAVARPEDESHGGPLTAIQLAFTDPA